MNQSHNLMQGEADENRRLKEAVSPITSLMKLAAKQLDSLIDDQFMRAEIPLEAEAVIETAAEAIRTAIARLESINSESKRSAARTSRPTRQQGQFLAFIREYIMRSQAGLAPSHADFQHFFNLTLPSVNSMLIRLEKQGYIRRVPGKAWAFELIIEPDQFPPLERVFKFLR
jgi:hypothetical protein